MPTSKGGLGLRSIEDELDNQMITQCIKMLSSPDDFVKGVAAASLDATVLQRYGRIEGHGDRWRFLSAQLKALQESRKTNDISTIFSCVRTFARDLKGLPPWWSWGIQVTRECVGGRQKSPRAISQGTLACSVKCQGGCLVQEVDRPCRAGSVCPFVRQNLGIQLLDQRLQLPQVP